MPIKSKNEETDASGLFSTFPGYIYEFNPQLYKNKD